jgi:lysophospholipase L1-like esterase
MRCVKTFSVTILAVLLLAGFTGLLIAPGSPVGDARAEGGEGMVSVCIGDSNTLGFGLGACTYPLRLNARLNGTMINSGVGGDHTTGMLERFSTDVLSYNPDNIFIMGGTMDIYNTETIAETEANLASMVSQGVAAGATVYLLTILPSSTFTSAQQTELAEINAWIMSQAAEDVIPVDVNTALRDPSTPTQLLAAYDTGDHVHLSKAGAERLAATVLKAAKAAGEFPHLKVWTASTDGNASVAANWDDGITPDRGDSILLDGTSSANITWDLDDSAVALQSVSIDYGYTGTFIQAPAADLAIWSGGYYQEAGSLLADSSSKVYCGGHFLQLAGTVVANKLALVTTGAAASIQFTSLTSVYSYENKGAVALDGPNGISTLRFSNSGNMNVEGPTAPAYIYVQCGQAASSFSNTGSISGSSKMVVFQFGGSADSNMVISFGTISAPVVVDGTGSMPGSRILSLSSSNNNLGKITIQSAHASNTLTLDCAGYDLHTDEVSVKAKGVLLGGEGDITTTTWDSSAGTWTPESSNVIFDGTSTVKTASGQTFYDVSIPAGSSLTMLSDMTITHGFELLGTINTNGFTLTLPEGWSNEIISTPGEVVSEDAVYSYTPQSNHTGTFTVTTDADWLIWDGTTLSGTPSRYDVGTYAVSILFENGVGQVYQNYTLEVEAHAISSTPVTVGHVGERYQYQVVSRYPALNYTITGPEWLTIDENGLVTGTPPNGTVGRYAVTVTVETANQTAVQTYTLEIKGAPITAENMNDTLVPIAVGVLVLAVLLASMAAMLGKVDLLLPRRPRP